MTFVVTVKRTTPARYRGIPPHLRSSSSSPPPEPPFRAYALRRKNQLIAVLAVSCLVLAGLLVFAMRQVAEGRTKYGETLDSLVDTRENLTMVSQHLLACQVADSLKHVENQRAGKRIQVLEEIMAQLQLRTDRLVEDSIGLAHTMSLTELRTINRGREVIDPMLSLGTGKLPLLVAADETVLEATSLNEGKGELHPPWWLRLTDFEAFCLSVLIAAPVVGICTLLKIRYKRKRRTKQGGRGL